MDLRAGEEILFEGHPSWRYLIAFYFWGVLVVLVIAIPAYFIEGAIGVLIGLIGIALVLVIGYVRRIYMKYCITTRRLWISRGIIARNVQECKLSRVQNVSTDQGLVERILRIGDVEFDTAGTDDSELAFRGMANPIDVVQAVDDAQEKAESLAHQRKQLDTEGL
jgi:uncharacterized membrane protein YdbT with pleckstrin-like domain